MTTEELKSKLRSEVLRTQIIPTAGSQKWQAAVEAAVTALVGIVAMAKTGDAGADELEEKPELTNLINIAIAVAHLLFLAAQ